MNSLELLNALSRLPVRTVGVFPADQIPVVWEKPCALVFNTDDSTKQGSHWVAVYVDRYGAGIFFDSYGLPPAIPQHVDRLRRNCHIYDWNIQQLQSIDSSVCGHYCIDFLFYMSSGYSMDHFCTLFSSNTVENDKLSVTMYKRILKNTKICKNKKIICTQCEQSCKPRTHTHHEHVFHI